MWIITLFEDKDFTMFSFDDKNEATSFMQRLPKSAILSYTY